MKELKQFGKWFYNGLLKFEFKILSVLAVIVWVLCFYILLLGVR